MRTALPVLLLAATPLTAHGQTATGESRDIVVLGAPLPLPPGTPAYGAIEIDRGRLTDNAAGRLEDVLKDVAGFQQFRRSDSRSANPSAQGATLRALGGNASSRALLLLDGVPMADPFFGYVPFSALVPERLAAARVTRGGGAGAFGAGSVAGVIELASASRAQLPLFSATAVAGSRNSQELSASFTPDLGAGFVSLSGRWDRGDGFLTTPAAQRVPATVASRYRDWSLGLRAVTPLAATTEIQFRALLFRDNRTLRFAGADSGSSGEDVSIRLVRRGAWTVDALAYGQARNFSNIVISSTSFRRTLDQRDTPSIGLGGKIEVRPPVGDNHLLRVGIDSRLAHGELFENAYSGTTGALTTLRNAGGRTTSSGAFVEDDWTIGRLILTGGGRIDRWTISNGFFTERNAAGIVTVTRNFARRSGWQATGRAGVLYRAGGGLDVRGAAYTGFRLPTLNELYRPFVVFPVATQANEALELERLRGVEAGIDIEPLQGLRLSGTLFHNRLADAIANVTIGANLRQRRNVDAIVARGVEISGEARLSEFSLLASYAHSDSRVQASGVSAALDGFTPAQSPRHSASATLRWDHAGFGASTTLRYIGRQYEDDLQTDILPGAVTIDGTMRVQLRRGVALIGRAENIFDRRVVTRNQAGSIDLGNPRTLWFGIRVQTPELED